MAMPPPPFSIGGREFFGGATLSGRITQQMTGGRPRCPGTLLSAKPSPRAGGSASSASRRSSDQRGHRVDGLAVHLHGGSGVDRHYWAAATLRDVDL